MRTIGPQEREEAESIEADFSIIRLKGAKKDRVLVGPIRFVNHSCNANAMFAHHSEKTTEIFKASWKTHVRREVKQIQTVRAQISRNYYCCLYNLKLI